MQSHNTSHQHEVRSILILSLGFGLVGIDRYLISTMFPAIASDLDLGYTDIGVIAGALAFAWGFAALIMGNAADRFGRNKVMVGSLIVFSLLIGASGLAEGLIGLILVRVVMGFADGAFTPASISSAIANSKPTNHGRNIGIQQMAHILFGLGVCPVVVALLLNVISWRWVFLVFLIPGLYVAWLTYKYIPDNVKTNEKKDEVALAASGHGVISLSSWKLVLSVKNIPILMLLMLCWLMCLITTSAFLPSYFVDHLALNETQMGFIMSAIGFGAAAGSLLLSWASDKIGRKAVVLLSAIGALASLYWLSITGASPAWLFTALFFVQFFNFAGLTLTVGPICSESVPVHLMATASGVVIACGEILGGGLAPILAGNFADKFGIEQVLLLPMGGLVLATCLGFALKETKPAHS